MPVNFSYAPNPQLRTLPHLQLMVMEQFGAFASLAAADDPTNGRLRQSADGIDNEGSRSLATPGTIFVLTMHGIPGGTAIYRVLFMFSGTYYELTTEEQRGGGFTALQIRLVSSAVGTALAMEARPTIRPSNNTGPQPRSNVSIAQTSTTYANNPMGDNPYANNPMGDNPYANNPMAGNPYANNPMAQNPYANNPMAQNPYANNPAASRPTITRSGLSNLLARTRARFG